MNQWRFELFSRSGFADVHGSSVYEDIKDLPIVKRGKQMRKTKGV